MRRRRRIGPTRVCMIAYTTYSYDARVRREAETVVATGRYEVTLIVPREERRARSYELNGVRVREVAVGQYQGKHRIVYVLSYLGFMLRASISCVLRFLFRATSVFHVHNMPDILVFATLVPRLLGARVILDVHDTMPETYATKYESGGGLVGSLLQLEERVSCALANRVIAVNEIQAQKITGRGVLPEKLAVILNVPDDALFTPAAVSTEPGLRIVYHGTVVKRLGVDLLLHAMSRVLASVPQARLVVYGSGDDMDEFARLARDELPAGVAAFPGGVPLQELPAILSTMDVGVVPNRRSPATELMLPVKMMEYFAVGVPVVAADLPTIRHYVGEDVVTFFDPGDADALASALVSLLSNADRRRAQREAGFAFNERYGWRTHRNDLIALYDDLVGHGALSPAILDQSTKPKRGAGQ